jgi:hypothetical protein
MATRWRAPCRERGCLLSGPPQLVASGQYQPRDGTAHTSPRVSACCRGSSEGREAWHVGEPYGAESRGEYSDGPPEGGCALPRLENDGTCSPVPRACRRHTRALFLSIGGLFGGLADYMPKKYRSDQVPIGKQWRRGPPIIGYKSLSFNLMSVNSQLQSTNWTTNALPERR